MPWIKGARGSGGFGTLIGSSGTSGSGMPFSMATRRSWWIISRRRSRPTCLKYRYTTIAAASAATMMPSPTECPMSVSLALRQGVAFRGCTVGAPGGQTVRRSALERDVAVSLPSQERFLVVANLAPAA